MRCFLEQIHQLNPDLNLVYAVRGQPVVNNVIAEDARQAGIHRWARILSNGDDALGTLLPRTSPEFQAIYHQADLLLCKGQANYECLIDQPEKSRYFLLKIKCSVLAFAHRSVHRHAGLSRRSRRTLISSECSSFDMRCLSFASTVVYTKN